jgi:hypothetical protein
MDRFLGGKPANPQGRLRRGLGCLRSSAKVFASLNFLEKETIDLLDSWRPLSVKSLNCSVRRYMCILGGGELLSASGVQI